MLDSVTLVAAFLLDEPVASLLRRERYVRGEPEQEAFERRLDRLLDPEDPDGGSGSTDDRRDSEVLTGTAGSSGPSGRNR